MQIEIEMKQQTQQLEKERELEDHAVRAAKEAEVSKARKKFHSLTPLVVALLKQPERGIRVL